MILRKERLDLLAKSKEEFLKLPTCGQLQTKETDSMSLQHTLSTIHGCYRAVY